MTRWYRHDSRSPSAAWSAWRGVDAHHPYAVAYGVPFPSRWEEAPRVDMESRRACSMPVSPGRLSAAPTVDRGTPDIASGRPSDEIGR